MRLPRRFYYILAGRMPVPVQHLLQWAQWFETADRHVALTQLKHCRVSTIFLGLDHNFSDVGPPVLFETMAFQEVGHPGDSGEALSSIFGRYSTWQQAEAGHARCVDAARRVEAEMEREAQPALDQLLLRIRQAHTE
jgi:hypothetical protein